MNTCCPPNFTYNPNTGLCESATPLPPIPNCLCYTLGVTSEPGSIATYTFTATNCDGTPFSRTLSTGASIQVCLQSPVTQTFISIIGGNFSNATSRPKGSCFLVNGSPSCSGTSTIVTQVPTTCPCCPVGYYYIDASGNYYDLVAKKVVAVTNTNIANGKCAQFLSSGIAQNAIDPIACACCPLGSVWVDYIGRCVLSSYLYALPTVANTGLTDPVPCIACVCPEPDPPPPCVGCMESQGLHTHFTFDPTRKQCKECGVVGEPVPLPGQAGQFMPIQLQDPIINFRLRS